MADPPDGAGLDSWLDSKSQVLAATDLVQLVSKTVALKRQAGDARQPADQRVGVPTNPAVAAAAIAQLQNTLNAVIAAFNAHTHAESIPAATVWTGGIVTAGAALTVDVSALEIQRADGTFKASPLVDELALATADGSNPRLDLVQVHTTTGTVTKKNGVAAASPVAPTVDAGNIALATVLVPATATAPTTITDVRPRPGADSAAVPAAPIDGTATSATNAFTAS